MKRGTRIGPDGSIISDEDGSSSGGSGGAGGGRRSLCPSTVDAFGFHLELKHFAIVLLFISVTMGPIGSEFYDVFARDVYYVRFCARIYLSWFSQTKIALLYNYHTQLFFSCSYYQFTHTIKDDQTMVVEVEGVQSGKMARRLEKILKELVIFPNHPRVDEVPACVRRQHAL
jgi:hypothetical protein